ncbi:uncharacterized protein DEA37_0009311 [Paragonimus westermani]|uniref:Molybdopterin cofactor biosynthesis C (MoaC) domain-containing protein n=1 Tax=Paragonimus westermani TaxID=34504 RepID=A0A5J4NK67_9TREM|nr:uncharacterized protein DEA37_0009311 [Paragonimus westermani]
MASTPRLWCRSQMFRKLPICLSLMTSQQCDSASLVQMVDISAKHCEYLTRFQRKPYLESPPLVRWAKARSHVQLSQDLLEELGLRPDGSLDSRESSLITPKGNVFLVAKLAAIQAAKNTPYLLPLCHQVSAFSINCHTKV